ncbi:FUSC family protein [Bradyrhizobium sp. PUT101]|uniref:FUSC family protein n=1 Tax=Bradyrhizobium sp. PUT101 TaxID=3447427 RepID=UPI003F84B8F6
MILPTRRDWLFSAKTYMAAMLALYIALAFGLPRPYWAMTAVYVVANPISGATVSKALDRTLGTLLGATGTVILVPLLVNAPELLTFAIAAWAGTFLYIALHDRTPRNYVFLLAGYTLPLIALPSVGAPESIFDVAVARTEEITVGIVVTAAIGTTVFPVSVGSALNARITKWLSDAGAWTREILLAGGAEHFTPLARQQLAADISPLAALISQLAHDAGTRDVRRHAEELRGRLLFLLPILSSIADRLHALKLELKELPPDLQALTGCIAAWLKAPSETADPQIPDRLRAGLSDLKPPVGDPHLWPGLIRLSLVARLGELIDLWQDCLILQKQIRLGRASARWRPMLRHRPIVAREQHYDQGLMLFSVASTILATFTAGLLWIWSGWSGGANAVAFVAIACCFFGGVDRPAPFVRAMLIWCCVTSVLTSIYVFVILPYVNDFELLALVLAPPFLLIGAFIPRPELSLITLLLATNLAGDLALQGRYSADFISYAEGGIAIGAGVLFALIWTLVTRPFGAELAARRLIRAGWDDLAELAAGTHAPDHARLTGRMLDRLGQLVPRLASDETSSLRGVDGLAELRIGYNVLALQRNRRALPGDVRALIDSLLQGIAEYFRQCAAEGERLPAPEALLHDIDRALRVVLHVQQGQLLRTSLDPLVGLRRALFPLAIGPTDDAPGTARRDALHLMPVAAE